MQYSILYIALLCLFIYYTNSILTDPYYALIEKVRNSQDVVTMAMITRRKDCQRCDIGNEIFREFQKEYDGIIQMFLIECENYNIDPKTMDKLAMVCEMQNQHLLPHITFFGPQLYDISLKEKPLPKDSIYQGVVDREHLYAYAYNQYPITYSEIENSRDLRVFLDDKNIKFKVLYVDDMETVPLLIKALSCQYRDRINFGLIDRDNDKLLQKFLIKKYPTLLAMAWDNQGKQYSEFQFDQPLSYRKLTEFLDKVLNQENIPKKINIDSYLEQNQVHIINYNELINLIKNKDYWYLLELTKANDHPRLRSLQNHFGDFFKYLRLDCQEPECQVFVSSNLKLSTFPQLVIYPIGSKTLDKFITILPNDTVQSITENLFNYVTISEKVVRDDYDGFQHFLFSEIEANKFPVVWFYHTSDLLTRLFIHTFNMMGRYQRFIKFAKFPDPSESNFTTWKIDKNLPSFTVYLENEEQNYKTDTLPAGKKKNFFEYVQFFDNLLTQKENQFKNSTVIEQVKTMDQFEEKCQKNLPCIIAFLDVVREQKYKQDIEKFQKLRDYFLARKYNWVWIDGYCHKEMLKALDLSENKLSHLVYYEGNKQKFKAMGGKFVYKSMIQFIEQLKNKKGLQSIENDLDMEDNNCDFIKNEVKYKIEKERQRKKEEKEKAELLKKKKPDL